MKMTLARLDFCKYVHLIKTFDLLLKYKTTSMMMCIQCEQCLIINVKTCVWLIKDDILFLAFCHAHINHLCDTRTTLEQN